MTGTTRKSAHAKMTIAKHVATSYDAPNEGPHLARARSEENYSGDIEGTGELDFLQSTDAMGRIHFVGIKRITGTLDGKQGSFLLQDIGTIENKNLSGKWVVIPGSGTHELIGIRGEGGIDADIEAEKHDVRLDYWFE